jgi:hypothetical protein
MPLVWQERADGFRVVRMIGDTEQMLANVETRLAVSIGTNEFRELLVERVRSEGLSSEQARQLEVNGVTLYKPLPRGECTIHSAIGPLTVADIEEILIGLPRR